MAVEGVQIIGDVSELFCSGDYSEAVCKDHEVFGVEDCMRISGTIRHKLYEAFEQLRSCKGVDVLRKIMQKVKGEIANISEKKSVVRKKILAFLGEIEEKYIPVRATVAAPKGGDEKNGKVERNGSDHFKASIAMNKRLIALFCDEELSCKDVLLQLNQLLDEESYVIDSVNLTTIIYNISKRFQRRELYAHRGLLVEIIQKLLILMRSFNFDGFEMDLYLPGKKLNVEIDGKSHFISKLKDQTRDKYFEKKGIKVIRIPSYLYMDDAKAFLSATDELLKEYFV